MVSTNPFKPTAGMTPPVLMGREDVIQDFSDGLLEGPGSPGRLMRITGPRGSGKTVLLTELGEIAASQGWRVVDVVSDEDICDSIARQLRRVCVPKNVTVSASLPFVSAEMDFDVLPEDATFREVFEYAVRRLTRREGGLVITLDEAQNVDREAMSTIASCVQLMIRERQNVAFVFAGITTGVLDLLNDKSLTFLRRAKSEELASIPVDEVADALRETIERSGMHIGDEALSRAAEATEGYAYLTQLVGYNVWRTARRHADESTEITLADVAAASGWRTRSTTAPCSVPPSPTFRSPPSSISWRCARTRRPRLPARSPSAWENGRRTPTRIGASSSRARSSRQLLRDTLLFPCRACART